MGTSARIIGGAGTGKTTRLMDLMERNIDRGTHPLDIGFVSFTRAARAEAMARAASRFNLEEAEIEANGWFRTLHSICYRVLGIRKGQVISDDRKSKEWIEEAIGRPVMKPTANGSGDDDDESTVAEIVAEGDTPADIALKTWGRARNRLVSLEDEWSRLWEVEPNIPALDECVQVVEDYEQAKRLDDRCDFTDLLGRFAGWRFTADGAESRTPENDRPELPVWFFDEQQDTSALLDAVCRRLSDGAKFVYLVGDPFQSIYGWAGMDARHFLGYPVAKEQTLPVSYRCPANILDLGEDILKQCSDYFPRGIVPVDDRQGEIDTTFAGANAAADIDPRGSWLVIARTNRETVKLKAVLNRHSIPWRPTKGNGGWHHPARTAGMKAFYYLQHGAPINGDDWKRAIELISVKDKDGSELLARGTKKRFADKEFHPRQVFPRVMPADLPELGATPMLMERIASGRWTSLIGDEAHRYVEAIEHWGEKAVEQLNVRVGTIHSVKGAEADNVLLLTTTTRKTSAGQRSDDGFNEERRVEYVGVTRARNRLIVASNPRDKYRMELPI